MHQILEDLIRSYDLRPVAEALSKICLGKAHQLGILAAESANLETAAQFEQQSIELFRASVQFELLGRKLTPPRNHGDEQLAAYGLTHFRNWPGRN
jgi:hypothetical protein